MDESSSMSDKDDGLGNNEDMLVNMLDEDEEK